jgi:ACT domain-containing protein
MDYITQDDAAQQLGVSRSTFYYYMKILEIKKHKFPLDKHAYVLREDFEKIKALKENAARRSGEVEESAA